MTPSATGKLSDTPLAHALIYARNRRLSGRLDLATSGNRRASIAIWRGRIASVTTTPPGLVPNAFFGVTAYELGFIDQPTLDETLLVIAKTKRLHGEILIERKKLTPEYRDHTLVEQIHRKVHHLFSFDDETTTYAFYDDRGTTDPPLSVELVGPVWRGVRDYPPLRVVAETVRRVGENQLRLLSSAEDKHMKPRLPPLESAIMARLAEGPKTLAELKAGTELPAGNVDLLAYLLVIAKHIESVSGERMHPSTGALPVQMPSGPVPIRSPGAISSTRIPAYTAPTPKQLATPAQAFSPTPLPNMKPIATPAQPFSPIALAAAKTTASLVTVRSPAELGLEGITERAKVIDKDDYFTVLGLPDGASAEAVRASYMRLAKTWHPDKLVVDFFSVRGDVAKVFSQMTLAQNVLTDPEARRAYIAARRPQQQQHNAPRTRDLVMREVTAAFAARNFELAAKLCQELITANGDDAEALALQAWADVRAGDASEEEHKMALLKTERAVNVDRTSASAHYHRGLVQKKLNNALAAFRDFARAVQLDPTHTDAEREVRIFAMRAKKGSGEHKLAVDVLQKIEKK